MSIVSYATLYRTPSFVRYRRGLSYQSSFKSSLIIISDDQVSYKVKDEWPTINNEMFLLFFVFNM